VLDVDDGHGAVWEGEDQVHVQPAADREVVGQAPWVPIYNPVSTVLLSPRVGNYQFDPYYQLLIDRLWVR
jgi:ABC-type transport system substrate-binding protein